MSERRKGEIGGGGGGEGRAGRSVAYMKATRLSSGRFGGEQELGMT